MRNDKKIMELALDFDVAADIVTRAAQASASTQDYLEMLVLTGAYGVLHPRVRAARIRANVGVYGPKTPESPQEGEL